MPQLFYKDGSPIPDAAIPEAIANKQAFAKPGAPIAVRDVTTGQLGRIDASELDNPNYQPLSDAEINAERIHKERGTLGQKAITVGEGAARGATLGLSDVALTGALGNDYRKGADERKEENSKLAIASELGGAIAPAFLTGGVAAEAEGASLLARGASTAAKVASAPVRAVGALGGAVERGAARVLGGVGGEGLLASSARSAASHALGGAVEGAVFGAGATLSESALKGEPITSEALVASLGRNALFGGAIGGAVGALSKLGPAAARSVLPSAETLDATATKFARKQLGRDFENVGKGQSREVAEAWKDASAKQLLERKLVGGENAGKTVFEASKKPQDIADNLGQMRRDIGEEIGAVHDKAAALIDANPHLAPTPDELISRLEAKAKELQGQHNSGAYSQARAVRAEVKALRNATAVPIEAVAPVGEGAEVLGGAIPVNDVAPSFGYTNIRAWQQNLERQLNPQGVPKSMRAAAVKNLEARQAVSDIANEYIKETAANVLTATGSEDASILSRLNREYAGAKEMQYAAEKEAGRVAKNRSVSLTDHMLGIGAALMGMASGNVGALTTMGLGGAAAIGNKIMREQGNATMALIAQRLAKHDSLIDSAAKALAVPQGIGRRAIGEASALSESRHAPASDYVPLGAVALRKDFDEARERVQQLGTPEHMQAQLAHATGPVANGYPEAATGMSQRLLGIHDYLAKSIPVPEAPPIMTPLARAAGVEPREMQKWLAKVNAALDPMTVIRDVARGKLDHDAVQTLRDVYPETFGQLRSLTIKYTSANKEQLPFSRVVHLSDVFGFDGDSSMSPARLPGIQAAIQQINAPPNGKPPGTPGQTKRARPSSAQSNKLGKLYNLPGQATPGDN